MARQCHLSPSVIIKKILDFHVLSYVLKYVYVLFFDYCVVHTAY